MIAASALDVLNQAARWLDDGRRVALVTLVGIEGTTSRSIGTQMAVADDGRSIGPLSGGCIEAAIVAEARDALRAGAARVVRFGVGSPYIDVRLPCGGGST
jgi:xanthine dehydrogenase accessory factor